MEVKKTLILNKQIVFKKDKHNILYYMKKMTKSRGLITIVEMIPVKVHV
jgi:hypothetical protein